MIFSYWALLGSCDIVRSLLQQLRLSLRCLVSLDTALGYRATSIVTLSIPAISQRGGYTLLYPLTDLVPKSYFQPRSSRVFHHDQALAESIIKLYGHRQQRPRKSYYARKTSFPRYSELQYHTSLSPPHGPPEEHRLSNIRDRRSRIGYAQCRFTLRGIKQKGTQAPRTMYGCLGPGCSFSLCINCFKMRHKDIFSYLG